MTPLPQWPCQDCGVWQLIVPNATRVLIDWTAAGPSYQVETECAACDHTDQLHVERDVATRVVAAFMSIRSNGASAEFWRVLQEGGAL